MLKLAPLDPKWLLLAGGIVVVVLAIRSAASSTSTIVGDAAAAARRALDPTDPDNLAARGVNAAVTAATGRDETLGGWLWDVTHPDPVNPRPTPTIVQPVGTPTWNGEPLPYALGA